MHTPLITGSDCEGAGEMFRVTTMDMENLPKNEDGTVDYTQDFFGKETSRHSVPKIPIRQDMRLSSG